MKIKTIGKITSKSKKFDFSLEEQERHIVIMCGVYCV